MTSLQMNYFLLMISKLTSSDLETAREVVADFDEEDRAELRCALGDLFGYVA